MCNYNLSPERELSISFGPEDPLEFQEKVGFCVDLFTPLDGVAPARPKDGMIRRELAHDVNPMLVATLLEEMGIHPALDSVK